MLVDEDWGAWQLDGPTEPATERERYTKAEVKRGEVEFIGCKAKAIHVRRIAEIVESRVEPELKTKSDVLQDALVMWLEDWDRRHPDFTDEHSLRAQDELDRMQQLTIARKTIIAKAKGQLDALREDGDIVGLRRFLRVLEDMEEKNRADAPAKFMKDLADMTVQVTRLLAEVE